MTTPLEELLNRHLDTGTFPGAVALLSPGAHPEEVEVVAMGVASDAIMRIQSMTKVVTAVAALRLVEAGRLGLDYSIDRWLPELADRRVLRSPDGALADTEPAERPITVRDLLTCCSGYGMPMTDSALLQAMTANGTAAGPEPVGLGAEEWLARLADLPLMFHPGRGWRYHHSFALLGILLSRVVGRELGEHLAEDLFDPLQMSDTAFFVPAAQLHRLPAACRHSDAGLVETEPAGGGFYAGPPPFDVSHSELVSTVADFHRFLRLLVGGGEVAGRRMLAADYIQQLTSDQVPSENKTPDSFFPGFWDGMGWGYGVGVQTAGPHRGRYGWSGGQGTDFFVDPDGSIAILFTQVELGPAMMPLLTEFQSLA